MCLFCSALQFTDVIKLLKQKYNILLWKVLTVMAFQVDHTLSLAIVWWPWLVGLNYVFSLDLLRIIYVFLWLSYEDATLLQMHCVYSGVGLLVWSNAWRNGVWSYLWVHFQSTKTHSTAQGINWWRLVYFCSAEDPVHMK